MNISGELIMKVDVTKESDKITLNFIPDNEDRISPSEKFSFGNPKVIIKIPDINNTPINIFILTPGL